MKHLVLLLCLFLYCDGKEDEREPKFFFAPKPQKVLALRKVPEIVTEFVPSSCIVIEPTLPACRHVRNLEIYPSVPTRITKTQIPQNPTGPKEPWKPAASQPVHHSPTPPLQSRPQQVKYTQPYWNWNLFNIFRVQNFTYTTTKTEYVTTRVEDPNTVVSFYVKGCRPSKLPFELSECPKPQEPPQEKSIVVMAPIKFVPNVESLIAPSKANEWNAEESAGEENDRSEGSGEKNQTPSENN